MPKNMTARNHHYLSQCYLKGFTSAGSRKSKLTVIDLKGKKKFLTKPRNIGGIRDFNRVEITGVDPNIIENAYAELEGRIAIALNNIHESLNFDNDNKQLILNLIALFAVRSPEQRQNLNQFQAKIADQIMNLSLATKERWESLISQMKDEGYEGNGDISYEEIKAFHQSKKYEIKVVKERHIQMELQLTQAVLQVLRERNWLLIHATNDSGPFITTDNPVNLTWIEPEKIPPFYRDSPGFGSKGTHVYFPLSKKIALLGEFEGKNGSITASKNLVAALNSKMLRFVFKQVYASKVNFYFLGHDGSILEGGKILKEIQA